MRQQGKTKTKCPLYKEKHSFFQDKELVGCNTLSLERVIDSAADTLNGLLRPKGTFPWGQNETLFKS